MCVDFGLQRGSLSSSLLQILQFLNGAFAGVEVSSCNLRGPAAEELRKDSVSSKIVMVSLKIGIS